MDEIRLIDVKEEILSDQQGSGEQDQVRSLATWCLSAQPDGVTRFWQDQPDPADSGPVA
jgi:hypothetical protein